MTREHPGNCIILVIFQIAQILLQGKKQHREHLHQGIKSRCPLGSCSVSYLMGKTPKKFEIGSYVNMSTSVTLRPWLQI